MWREEKLEQLQVSANELQPIRFQGQSFDTETGLHYNRFRYFDPDLGMFTSRDPIGLIGGSNVFQYAPNPTGWIDPFGLAKKKKCTSPSEPSSPSKMNQEVKRGQAPRDVTRVDRGHIPNQEPHFHYSDGTSSTVTGGVHDAHKGTPSPSKATRT